MQIITEHLIIRSFDPDDAERLYANHLEEEVKKWIPNESYADISEAAGAIEFFSSCVEGDHLPYVLAVESKDTHALIGDVGINEVEGRSGEVEIGFTVCKAYSGKGLATELVRAMTEFSMEKFGSSVIYGRVLHGNDASVRVLQKNGYTYVTEEFGAEDDPYGDGMLVYKMERQ